MCNVKIFNDEVFKDKHKQFCDQDLCFNSDGTESESVALAGGGDHGSTLSDMPKVNSNMIALPSQISRAFCEEDPSLEETPINTNTPSEFTDTSVDPL